MNGIIIGCILYLVILFLFVRFGKFLKDCDEQINEQMHDQFVDKIERGEK